MIGVSLKISERALTMPNLFKHRMPDGCGQQQCSGGSSLNLETTIWHFCFKEAQMYINHVSHTQRKRKRVFIFISGVIISLSLGFFFGHALHKIKTYELLEKYEQRIDQMQQKIHHMENHYERKFV